MMRSDSANMVDHISGDSRDASELERFGYRQQLARTMGGFSSFAVSFSLISIITGIFANFGHGLREAGPAVLWTWLIAVAGQFLVALVAAELAAQFPLAGYGYQWSARLIGPRFGFFVGWFLLAQWLTGFPGICKTLAEQLHGIASYQFAAPPSVSWITVAIISLIAMIHLFGIRLAALVNDLGVIAEIVGAAAITLVLLVLYLMRGTPPLDLLLESTNFKSGLSAGPHAVALSLLLGAWCITGFEGAADLAEETHNPRQTVPRAVILSELSSGIGGFFMLAAFILSISDLHSIQASDKPLLDVIRLRLGDRIMPVFVLLILVSIFACGVASMAATTRLLFALARDRLLPCSALLSDVQTKHAAPRNAILTVWLLSCAIVLGLERFESLEMITAIATIAGYLGYAGIAIAGGWGASAMTTVGGFSLGRWRKTIAASALVWTLLVVVALLFPRDKRLESYYPIIAIAATLGAGTIIYLMVVARGLADGSAGPPPPTT